MKLPPEQEAIRAKCFHPSGTFVEFPKEEIETSIPARFEKIVKTHPGRIAVSVPSETLTYEQLNRRVNRLANAILLDIGDKQEPVGVLLAKGLPLIVAVLGVLKAGKSYVLVDPYFPAERINYILNHAQARLVLCYGDTPTMDRQLACGGRHLLNFQSFTGNEPAHDPGLAIPCKAPAAIHYTSGSTSEPKGVIQSHEGILHRVLCETTTDRVSIYDRFTFPASRGGQIFYALLNGASVYPTDIKEIGFPGLIKSLLEDKITIYASVTSTFRYLLYSLKNDQVFPHLRLIKLIGEPLYKNDIELYKKHFAPRCIVINRLGSNETGTFCQNFINEESILDDNVISVGFPTDDAEVLLLDDVGRQVPDGEIGEFAVRGRYLATGYWRNAALTNAKFTADPNDKELRLYRVGDLGRKRGDGSYVHLGRKDFQLKINGNRVEVAEVEAVLLNCANVKEAVVAGKDDRLGSTRLVAFVVARSQVALNEQELRAALKAKFPEFMVPSRFVFLDALPVIGTGKVDRKTLVNLDRSRPQLLNPYVAPHSVTEKILSSIWADVLDLDIVGIRDNFFDLGGHSLAAMRLVSRVINQFQLEIPLQSLFQSPTIADMAVVIAAHQGKPLDEQGLAAVLNELEELSEEDAKRLVNAQRQANSKG